MFPVAGWVPHFLCSHRSSSALRIAILLFLSLTYRYHDLPRPRVSPSYSSATLRIAILLFLGLAECDSVLHRPCKSTSCSSSTSQVGILLIDQVWCLSDSQLRHSVSGWVPHFLRSPCSSAILPGVLRFYFHRPRKSPSSSSSKDKSGQLSIAEGLFCEVCFALFPESIWCGVPFHVHW